MTNRLLSRKFLLAGAVVLSASVLCWFTKIDGTVYAAVVGGVVAAYFGANVTQKAVA
jgi:hypothetical protein